MLRRLLRPTLLLPVVALVLAACTPSTSTPPPTVDCAGVSSTDYGVAIEQCHLRYRSYKLDSSNASAQLRANYIATNAISCSNLANWHMTGPQLLASYPGATAVAENLFCYGSAPGTCPTTALGATKAINAWLSSSGHKANMDSFAGQWVNGGGACNRTRGLWFAVTQYHKP